MKFDRFRELYKKYSVPDWRGLDMSDFNEYSEAIQENQEFSQWALKTSLEAEGFNHKEYCCITMANHIFMSYDKNGKIDTENHDVIMNKWKDGTFGIPIYDGGSSIVKINFCPWCGTNLIKDE